MKPRITLELRKSRDGSCYIAHLVVGTRRIWIDVCLPDWESADDYHTSLAKDFAAAGIALVEDIQ